MKTQRELQQENVKMRLIVPVQTRALEHTTQEPQTHYYQTTHEHTTPQHTNHEHTQTTNTHNSMLTLHHDTRTLAHTSPHRRNIIPHMLIHFHRRVRFDLHKIANSTHAIAAAVVACVRFGVVVGVRFGV